MAHPIELEGLTKWYGTHRGIVDVDLVVEQGLVFGFLGPNGAGKTTAMRILLDIHRATSGTARVLGLDSRRDSVEIRRRVGYLAGDVALYGRMTAGELLKWLADLRGGLPAGRVPSLAERFDLDLSRDVDDLSKGNRQKVGLVQAFMHEPDLYVLDEPTSGLDPLVQHSFHEIVREQADAGRTVFLSSHVIDEVDRACHRVGIIREGSMVAVEDIDTLRARAARSMRIRFDRPVDPTTFESIDGVEGVSAHGDEVVIRSAGDMDAIVKAASAHRVRDLVSEQPELEDVFLGYYSGEGDGGDGDGDRTTGDTR